MYVPKTKFEVLKDVVRHCRNEVDNISYLSRDPLPFLHMPKSEFHILCGSLGTSESVYELARQLMNDGSPHKIQFHYFPENDVNGHMIVAIVVTESTTYYCGGMTDFSGTGGAAREWMLKTASLFGELADTGVFTEQVYHNSALNELWQGSIQQ